MEETYSLLLQALKAALKGEKTAWKDEIPARGWAGLFELAERQHILPLVYDAVYDTVAARGADPKMMAVYRQRTIQTVMMQTRKTEDFTALYQKLCEGGISPIVVKGIICRDLYPNPDYRISGDEDLLIPVEQFPLFHSLMQDLGMECADPRMDIGREYEVPYRKKGSPLYIEAHKSLFPPNSEAYGDLNVYFSDVEDRAIEVVSGGVRIRTMGYTDHLFYLLCHAYKHFLHSGVGIRQACDIILMANANGADIDWSRILKQCREIHAELFATAIFQIGEAHLVFDPDKAQSPEEWRRIRVDGQPLLNDMQSGGSYGAADAGRAHSSTVTLNAVTARKRGKKGKASFVRSVFPRASDLRGRYPWLRTKPFLLPVAWIKRILGYIGEIKSGGGSSVSESIRIGEQRVELLRTYGILEADDARAGNV
ncbi:MAG: nucleotidyltransferase family protein [Lachnospiraceae bacterium]|nr:nucleotidyltransferase family protein [Lachnospiraceae bacterium]